MKDSAGGYEPILGKGEERRDREEDVCLAWESGVGERNSREVPSDI